MENVVFACATDKNLNSQGVALLNYLPSRIHVLLILSTAFLLVSPITAGGCNSFSCGEFSICITGGSIRERDVVCVAAQYVHGFFQPLDLDFPVQLTIAFEQQTCPSEPFQSIGCYHPDSNTVVILDYKSAVEASHRAPPAFDTPMTFSLWSSYLVHEIAHAIVEMHSVIDDQSLAPTEYIAAVAQLSSLPTDVLEKILSNYRHVSSFGDKSEITELYYFMKPCEFAVRAYLHHLRPANGMVFICQLLLEGLPDSEGYESIPFF
ncbi:MAG: hypothetical protein KAU22_08790 [Desulfuromonadales bacterium]|nr:hypothetical protein [Desulfuromonadales bacterium]